MALESQFDTPTEHQGIALTLAITLDSCGLDSEAMFLDAGVDPAVIRSPDSRVVGEAMQRLWTAAVDATGDDALGIVFAEHFRVGALHGLGIAWATSDTLYDAFQRLVRYFRVICTVGDVVLEEDGDIVRLWLKLPVPAGVAVDASVDAGLALFIQLCRFARDPRFRAERVDFQRQAPMNTKKFHGFFDCPVHFGSPENSLTFRRSDLEKPLPMANPSLARANDRVVIDYLKRFDQADLVGQVRAAIIEALPSGIPTQEQIASGLGKSQRSLQRKLAEKSTTFTKLVEQIRGDLARQYLSEPRRSIGEISYLLGYSEPSNFARSFKHWTGQTPNQFRTER